MQVDLKHFLNFLKKHNIEIPENLIKEYKKSIRQEVFYNRKSRKFEGLTAEMVARFQSTYQKVDVIKELKKMALWLDRNRKRKGNLRFITNWLNRAEQQKARLDVTTQDWEYKEV